MRILQKLGLRDTGPKKWVLLGVVALLLWVLFLDSHSILNRLLWHREISELEARNTELRSEIDEIRTAIRHAGDAENVERVAREEYGMHREGETVYRVEGE